MKGHYLVHFTKHQTMVSERNLVLNLRLLDDHHRAMSMMSTVVTYAAQNSPATKFMSLSVSFHKQFLKTPFIIKFARITRFRNMMKTIFTKHTIG